MGSHQQGVTAEKLGYLLPASGVDNFCTAHEQQIFFDAIDDRKYCKFVCDASTGYVFNQHECISFCPEYHRCFGFHYQFNNSLQSLDADVGGANPDALILCCICIAIFLFSILFNEWKKADGNKSPLSFQPQAATSEPEEDNILEDGNEVIAPNRLDANTSINQPEPASATPSRYGGMTLEVGQRRYRNGRIPSLDVEVSSRSLLASSQPSSPRRDTSNINSTSGSSRNRSASTYHASHISSIEVGSNRDELLLSNSSVNSGTAYSTMTSRGHSLHRPTDEVA